MIRPIASAAFLCLVMTAASPALGQSRPYACAYDLFAEPERLDVTKQLAALMKAGDEKGQSELEAKLTHIIGQKMAQCPNIKAFTQQQQSIVFGYAMTAIARDSMNTVSSPIDGRPLVDAFWSGLPADVRQGLLAATVDPDKSKGPAAISKFLSQGYIGQFLSTNMLGPAIAEFLTGGVTAEMFLVMLDDKWRTGKPLE
jgi:hypothetical protein